MVNDKGGGLGFGQSTQAVSVVKGPFVGRQWGPRFEGTPKCALLRQACSQPQTNEGGVVVRGTPNGIHTSGVLQVAMTSDDKWYEGSILVLGALVVLFLLHKSFLP